MYSIITKTALISKLCKQRFRSSYRPSSFIKSAVENTFMIGCFLKEASLDQRGHCKCKAKAKYGASLACLAKVKASSKVWLYSLGGTRAIKLSKMSLVSSNTAGEGNFFLRDASFLVNSSLSQAGEHNTTFSDKMILLEAASLKNPAKKGFASMTKRIYLSPCLLATPSLRFLDKRSTSLI